MKLSAQMQDRGLDLAEKIGDRLGRAHVRLIMGARLGCEGDFAGQLECAMASRAEFEGVAEQPSAAGLGVWHDLGMLSAQAFLERPEEICPKLEEYAAAILRNRASDEELAALIVVSSLRAVLYTRMDELDRARAAADETVTLLERCGYLVQPPNWKSFDGPLDAYLACWDRARATGDPEAGELWRRARKLLEAMRKWTATNPFRRCRTFLYQGELAWRSQKPERAAALWRESLRMAEEIELRFEAAMAHLALGRTAAPGSASRGEHLAAAGRLFRRCRTCYYIDLVDSLI